MYVQASRPKTCATFLLTGFYYSPITIVGALPVIRFLRKVFQKYSPEQLEEMRQRAVIQTQEKWIYFHKTIRFADNVSLAIKIDHFAIPLGKFYERDYPMLIQGTGEIFWLSIFTAILGSETHTMGEVLAAKAELATKYAN